MNLLILTNNPNRASFRQRIAIYQDFLQANGIDCEAVRILPASLARQRLFRQAAKYDGVFLHKKDLNFIDAFFLPKYSKKIIYDLDDAIMYKDEFPERDSRVRFRRFVRSAKLADMVISGNSYLAEHASRFNRNVVILPTGLVSKPIKYKRASKTMGKSVLSGSVPVVLLNILLKSNLRLNKSARNSAMSP